MSVFREKKMQMSPNFKIEAFRVNRAGKGADRARSELRGNTNKPKGEHSTLSKKRTSENAKRSEPNIGQLRSLIRVHSWLKIS
jgi:hypothetical protein